MTTKPRHTTTKKRHGAGNRLNSRLATQDRLEKELRDALNNIGPSASDKANAFPDLGKKLREYTVVVFTVREGNEGLPRRWEYVAPPSVWQCAAEHEARLMARKQGLVIHAHIDTRKELRT